MRVAAIVECRMTSRRLPGKHLKPIQGAPMFQRLLERLARSRLVDEVVLATSTEPSDEVLADLAEQVGAVPYRGSLEDVLGRVVGAAREVDADIIVEITGDCPLVDPEVVDAVVGRYRAGGFDYVTNVLDRLTFPIGLDVQVYSLELLEEVERATQDPDDRENVTSFIYGNPDRYRLLNVAAPAALDRPGYRLCVDYPEDFELVRTVYDRLLPVRADFSAREVIDLLDREPELAASNTNLPGAFSWPSSGGAAAQERLDF